MSRFLQKFRQMRPPKQDALASRQPQCRLAILRSDPTGYEWDNMGDPQQGRLNLNFTLWCHQTWLENPRTEWKFS